MNSSKVPPQKKEFIPVCMMEIRLGSQKCENFMNINFACAYIYMGLCLYKVYFHLMKTVNMLVLASLVINPGFRDNHN